MSNTTSMTKYMLFQPHLSATQIPLRFRKNEPQHQCQDSYTRHRPSQVITSRAINRIQWKLVLCVCSNPRTSYDESCRPWRLDVLDASRIQDQDDVEEPLLYGEGIAHLISPLSMLSRSNCGLNKNFRSNVDLRSRNTLPSLEKRWHAPLLPWNTNMTWQPGKWILNPIVTKTTSSRRSEPRRVWRRQPNSCQPWYLAKTNKNQRLTLNLNLTHH